MLTSCDGWQVVGRLADKPAVEGSHVRGLLVRQGYTDSLMQPADLAVFTKLRPGRILQRQALACSKPFSEVHPYLTPQIATFYWMSSKTPFRIPSSLPPLCTVNRDSS